METQDLIATLTDEGARKPLPGVARQMLFWLAITIAWVGLFICHSGLRPDIMRKLAEPFYIPELALLTAIALSAGVAALCLSRPDGMQKSWVRWLPFAFMAPWAVTAMLNAHAAGGAATFMQTMNSMRFDCVGCILLCALAPAVAMFVMVRRGAVASSGWAGGLTALSVTTFSYLCMRLVEENDDPLHLLVWHAFPVLLVSLLGMAAGRVLLRWK